MNHTELLHLINQQLATHSCQLALTPQQCDIVIDEAVTPTIRATVICRFVARSVIDFLEQQLPMALSDLGYVQIDLQFHTRLAAYQTQHGLSPRAQVKNIIAVASGKGGVGKSTVTVNLALALQAEGAKVGILDADIYGPSQPHMLGSSDAPESSDGKTLQPIERFGLQVMSIGYLIDTDTAMIWRGPMVSTALLQLFNDTQWRDLDYLLIDLPPGTGDIQLTLSQKIPVAGAVIVTTPQDIALLDAKKGVAMFQKVQVPILGVVENMSVHVCSQCGHREALFGEGGGSSMAHDANIPLLGQIPLDIDIRRQLDLGVPSVVADGTSPISALYRDMAIRVSAQLALSNVRVQSRFPKITME